MGPLSHNLASDAMISQSQGNTSVPMAGLSTPAAPTMTNPVFGTQSTDSPPVMVNHAQANNEAAQLPTPETMIDQSKSPLFFYSFIDLFIFPFILFGLLHFCQQSSVETVFSMQEPLV